jgi:predicted protein tyrosine phosphatase
MQVDVYSRQQAVELAPVEGTVVISISTPGFELASLQEGWKSILRLQFHDCTEDNASALTPFNDVMAAIVHEFIQVHLGKDFMIHCDAGVSRSVAIGLFLREIFEAELTTHAIHTTVAYNSLVHRMLMRKYWEERLS